MATNSDQHWESLSPGLAQVIDIQQVIFDGRTAFQQIQILQTTPFGRCLVLDGKTQSSESDEFIYHETLVHPALVLHNEPRRVFIAGGGEGATLREVLKHSSVQKVVMVDIDQEAVELCRQYLPKHHQNSFDDPRLELHYADAMTFLEREGQRFDIILMDVPDPMEGGPAYLLYAQEFYSLAKTCMTDQGILVTHAGSAGPTQYHESFTAIHKTISSVFPTTTACHAYIPSFGSAWGFVIGSTKLDLLPIDLSAIDRRLKNRAISTLWFYDSMTHQNIFALPKYLRDAVQKETRIITKDTPLFVP